MNREELYQQEKQSLIDKEGKLAEGIEAILDAEKTEGILPESAIKTLETLRESLYDKKKALAADRFYIAVSGAMKSGKSTLLNALLFKKDVLSVAVTACTAKLTIMEKSDKKEVRATFYTADEWEEWKKAAEKEADENESGNDGITRESLEDYIAKGNRHAEKLGKTETVSEENLKDYTAKEGELMPLVNTITIYDPEISFDGAQIVDTPGTNDPVVMRSKIAEEYVKKADAIIYVLYSGNALNDPDRQQLEDIIIKSGKDARNLIFVVTKKDMQRKKDLQGRTLNEIFEEYFDKNLKTKENGGKMSTDLSNCPRVFVSGEAARIAQDIETGVILSKHRENIMDLFYKDDDGGLGFLVTEGFDPYHKAKDCKWLIEYSGIDELREKIVDYLKKKKKEVVIDGNAKFIEYIKGSCDKEVFGNLGNDFKKKLESIQKNVAEIDEEIQRKNSEIGQLNQSAEKISNKRNDYKAKDNFMQKLHTQVLEKFSSDMEAAVKRSFSDKLSMGVIRNIKSKCEEARNRVSNLGSYKGFFKGNATAANQEAQTILRILNGLNGVVRDSARDITGNVSSSVGKNFAEIQRFLTREFDEALSQWKEDVGQILPSSDYKAEDITFPTYKIAETIKELEDSVPEMIMNGIRDISIPASAKASYISAQVKEAVDSWIFGPSQNEVIDMMISELPQFIDDAEADALRRVEETERNTKNVINKVRREIVYGELPQKFFEVRKELFNGEFDIAASKIKRRMEESKEELEIIKKRKDANEAEAKTMRAEYNAKIAKIEEYRNKIESI